MILKTIDYKDCGYSEHPEQLTVWRNERLLGARILGAKMVEMVHLGRLRSHIVNAKWR